MPRIFLESIGETAATATGETARYLLNVLRLKPGDAITVLDGKGASYRAGIVKADKREVRLAIHERLPEEPENTTGITLIQGILKSDRMDLVVQKATELGVLCIVPAVTERSQVRKTRKTPRWAKIALEASRQSGRAVPPAVNEPVPLEQALKEAEGGLIFWEEGGVPLKEAAEGFAGSDSRAITLAVGPEGGFSGEEIGMAGEYGFTAVSLGNNILRAETAAIVAVALTRHVLGEM